MVATVEELQILLERVVAAEDLFDRAYEFYLEHRHDWHPGFRAYFEDYLERKRDQIQYNWYRVDKMGLAIALEQEGADLYRQRERLDI